MTIQRIEANFKDELQAQLHLLKKACHEFDAGDIHEFRNIARALRVILATDEQNSKSLVELAGHSDILFVDSRIVSHVKSIHPAFDLVAIAFGPQTKGIRAFLDDNLGVRSAPLNVWLNDIICDDKDGNVFNRLRLVKAVANSGGATHYPAEVRDYFDKIQSLGFTVTRAGRPVEIEYRDVEKHSIRQIAHEVIKTFESSYSRGMQVAAGTQILAMIEMVLYPGRKINFNINSRNKPISFPMMPVEPYSAEKMQGPLVRLPYEGTSPKALCPCGSNLQFRKCCSEARDFDADFIEAFEKRHRLGKFRQL